MTDINKIGEIHSQIADLLREDQLLAALEKMKTLVEEATDWNLRSEYENMKTTYHQMLHFISQGMEDPERGKMYSLLIIKGLVLNDRLYRAINIQQSTYGYYRTVRELGKLRHLTTLSDTSEWIKTQLTTVSNEEAASMKVTLFNVLWTSDIWSPNDRETVNDLINGLPEEMAALCISAVTLGLMQMYDPQKYLFLFDAYHHPANMVNQRAMTGIAIGCLMHDNRMMNNAEILQRVALAAEDDTFCNDLQQIQMQLLSCRETEKISRFMNEEFIPEMMKNPILKKDKTGLDSMVAEDGFNPEWEKWIESKNVKDKMHIMNELYSSGADIHMASFANMKNFPFFKETAHWFMPFDRKHPAISTYCQQTDEAGNFSFINMIEGSEFCDSDCYSLYLFLSSLPRNAQQAMDKHMPELTDEMQMQLQEFYSKQNSKEKVGKKYAQNLYRFYKLFPRKHEFTDIFSEEVNLQFCNTLHPLVSNPKHLKEVAMFLFNQKHYEEADMMYSSLEIMTIPSFEISQKRGFCMQQLKRYEEAIDNYETADLMLPENLWTLTHLAQCYNATGQIEKATHHYLKAESVSPDDLNLLLQTGNCLGKLGKYEEAFKRFFKVHYLNENSATVWRAIAWYSLMAGKMEQAERFYQMLENGQEEINEMDLLNIGHMHWIGHRYEKALKYYKRCEEQSSYETFKGMILADADSLLLMNISPMDIPIILDLVKRENQDGL